MSAPRLSLAMIVKDCERCLAAALESVRRYVDEMVVIDTGSSDRTREVAIACGAEVHEFPWQDDFSAARNESLRRVNGDWVFWMDSDDILPPESGARLRRVIDECHPTRVDALIAQVHCPPDAGSPSDEVTVVDHVKAFRTGRGFRFKGRVHEQVLWSIRETGGLVRWTDVFLIHANADVTADGFARKLERDLKLLDLELRDNPATAFTLFNLGMTLQAAGRVDEAIDAFSRAAAITRDDESHGRKLYALLGACWSATGHPEAAQSVFERGLRAYPGDPELRFRIGTLALRLGNYGLAARQFRDILDARPERYFGSIDQSISTRKARANLALALEGAGQADDAIHTWLEAAASSAHDPSTWLDLARACARFSGRYQAGRLVAHKALENAPSWFGPLVRGLEAARTGDESAADIEISNAVEQSCNNANLVEIVCRGLFETECINLARKHLEALAVLQPTNAAALHNLAATMARQGHHSQALRVVERSLELRPDAPQTHELRQQILKRYTPAPASATAQAAEAGIC